MLNAHRLIPALQIIFQSEIEFSPESFAELTDDQYEAYERKEGKSSETLYRVLQMEPQVIERQGNEKITLELSIVTESQKQLLLDAMAFIHRASSKMSEKQPTFELRLEYLRPRLPPVVIAAS